ncbi:Aste57867_8097 [Aphanomyces stellatus]|uniref:Aste57867_8097 protein n=1 Tax=Aphanomyces stellatus TaxID=120398 RepID=A0A485KJC2_9STRA|nr:hypothetical protein As57867_008067 [Aphanomyces stellatus]VFT84986.1 Aste57867_8097 [Aphanomyces stellatus]
MQSPIVFVRPTTNQPMRRHRRVTTLPLPTQPQALRAVPFPRATRARLEPTIGGAVTVKLACKAPEIPPEVRNAAVPLCCFPDNLLHLLLAYLDEDSIGFFGSAWRGFHAAAQDGALSSDSNMRRTCQVESIWAMMCDRIFSVQAGAGVVHLRRFKSWAHMWLARPRVKYQGLYTMRVSYTKEAEYQYSDVAKGTVLQATYYRYLSFKRDGTMLYAMTLHRPHEMPDILRQRRRHKEVFQGTYAFQKGLLVVDVSVAHTHVRFQFRMASQYEPTSFVASNGSMLHMCSRAHAPNTRLVLISHALFSPTDIHRRDPDYLDLSDQGDTQFDFTRDWSL